MKSRLTNCSSIFFTLFDGMFYVMTGNIPSLGIHT